MRVLGGVRYRVVREVERREMERIRDKKLCRAIKKLKTGNRWDSIFGNMEERN